MGSRVFTRRARTPDPAFYAYGYPRAEGVERARPRPAAASWVEEAGLFLLPYDAVRAAAQEFLASTYDACAAGLGWSADLLATDATTP